MNQEEMREWLVKHQKHCPVCGRRVMAEGSHAHHLFVRRLKQIDHLLWCVENIVLVCPDCHVPEAPDLNWAAAMQKWAMGFTPQGIREWMASLPTKVPLRVPGWFIEAEEDYYGR
jgi:hypothetical protein